MVVISASTATKAKTKTASKASGAGTQTKSKKTTRKKKPSAKASGSSSAQQILDGARRAKLDLAKQRDQETARRSDALWYRVEGVLGCLKEASGTKSFPEQVSVVDSALAMNGLSRADVTPQAMACLIEEVRRLSHCLVRDARDYAFAAGRGDICKADVQLACEMRPDTKSVVAIQQPKLNIHAQRINRVPLPSIPQQCYNGVLLPPHEHRLTSRTFDVIASAHTLRKQSNSLPTFKARVERSSKPSYGASQGKNLQISVNLETKTGKAHVEPNSSHQLSEGMNDEQKMVI